MKILFAGHWHWSQNEKGLYDAFVSLGHDVKKFDFLEFFQGKMGYYQRVFPFPGLAFWKLNRAFLQRVYDTDPDVVIIWNGTHVLPRTLRQIQSWGSVVVLYSNDDPFGALAWPHRSWKHYFFWIWYLKCVKDADVTFVNRRVNVKEAVTLGARNVYLLRSYFIPDLHCPVELSALDKERFACDVVFAGHYENDGRLEYLRALVQAGVHVRLFGGGYWTKTTLGGLSSYFGEVLPAHDEDYVKALCGAKICLCFLSKMNRDIYTRRCFEIPACGRLLLSERTDDLQEMFVEGKEAVFFSSKEELVEKAQWLLRHPKEIDRIAEAGRKRVWADSHDVVSRARQALQFIQKDVKDKRR